MDSDGPSTVILTVASGAWRDAFDALEPLVERAVLATLDQATSTASLQAGEVSLLLTDDQEIRTLNTTYRSKDQATNVLSFPSLDLVDGQTKAGEDQVETVMPPGPILLGDIAISYERVHAEAREQQKELTDHFAHLLVHGTLHLLGYDHDDDRRAEVMEGHEAAILQTLGFAAPYRPFTEADDASVPA